MCIMLLAAFFQSCYKNPVACFSISVNTDSIHVNQPVIFNGECSLHASEYYWLFYTIKDTLIYYNPIDTVTFKDTGAVYIELDVLNGSTFGSVYETIKVKP